MMDQEIKFKQKYAKTEDLPLSGNDPFYYHIFADTLPPEECYRMIPTLKDRTVESVA